MKKLTTLIVIIMMMIPMLKTTAQPGTWYFGHGIHFVDYYGPMKNNSILETTNWNGNIIPKWFSLGYAFTDAIRAQGSVSFMRIDKIDIHLVNDQWLDWDVALQYSLCDGYIIRKDFPIDPYLHFGLGYNTLNETYKPMLDGGFGINFWTGRYFAFNWQSTYNSVTGNKDYLHHALGMKLRIPAGKDSDGDGIVDSRDDCPTIPGLKKFSGCPDTDGDGIPDNKDRCPEVAGIAENFGCPGFNAEKKKEIEDEIRFNAKNINFETNKDVIMTESYKDLDNIIRIMNRFPTTRFAIEGHTDNVGEEAFNMDLSERRAQAVKKYFTGKGIDAGRLDAKGFGETKPIADNGTPEGRAQNRRVEIKIIDK